jgi:proline iminopeptidase
MSNPARKYKIDFITTEFGKVWTLRCGGGSKTPLLIIHGGPGYPHNYLERLKQLSGEREVIFYDQLGCGFSSRPAEDKFRKVEYFINEVSFIREALGLEEMVLLGHSWGAVLACEHAVAFPKGVKGVIFASPFLDTKLWMKGVEKNLARLPPETQETILKHEKEGTTYSEEYSKAATEYENFFGCIIKPTPKEVEESNNGFDLDTYLKLWGPSEFYCSGDLKNYQAPISLLPKVPVLFTCGKFDTSKEEFLVEIKRKVPDSTMIVFDMSSHMPHIEQEKNYLEVLRGYFEEYHL